MAKPNLEKTKLAPIPKERGPSRESLQSLEDREIKQGASGVLESLAAAESAEAMEDAERGSGEVAEQAREDKKRSSAGGGQARTQDEIEALRAMLLAQLPTQEVMVKQITTKLKRQEKILKTDYRKYVRHGQKAAWQLNIIVSKLRKLNHYFSTLAYATFDVIKNLWLKIVHGV